MRRDQEDPAESPDQEEDTSLEEHRKAFPDIQGNHQGLRDHEEDHRDHRGRQDRQEHQDRHQEDQNECSGKAGRGRGQTLGKAG